MIAVVVPNSRFTRAKNSSTSLPVCTSRAARRLIAQQHIRPFGDGARNRYSLLLSARELRRKVVHPLREANDSKALFRLHRIGRNFRHELDVLQSRQAWDQVVKLEHKTNMFARWNIQPAKNIQ